MTPNVPQRENWNGHPVELGAAWTLRKDGYSVEEFVRNGGPGKPPIDEAIDGKIRR